MAAPTTGRTTPPVITADSIPQRDTSQSDGGTNSGSGACMACTFQRTASKSGPTASSTWDCVMCKAKLVKWDIVTSIWLPVGERPSVSTIHAITPGLSGASSSASSSASTSKRSHSELKVEDADAKRPRHSPTHSHSPKLTYFARVCLYDVIHRHVAGEIGPFVVKGGDRFKSIGSNRKKRFIRLIQESLLGSPLDVFHDDILGLFESYLKKRRSPDGAVYNVADSYVAGHRGKRVNIRDYDTLDGLLEDPVEREEAFRWAGRMVVSQPDRLAMVLVHRIATETAANQHREQHPAAAAAAMAATSSAAPLSLNPGPVGNPAADGAIIGSEYEATRDSTGGPAAPTPSTHVPPKHRHKSNNYGADPRAPKPKV